MFQFIAMCICYIPSENAYYQMMTQLNICNEQCRLAVTAGYQLVLCCLLFFPLDYLGRLYYRDVVNQISSSTQIMNLSAEQTTISEAENKKAAFERLKGILGTSVNLEEIREERLKEITDNSGDHE